MRRFGAALGRLLRPEQHIVLRLIYEQPLTVNDVLSVPRLDTACESVPGCCAAWANVSP